MGAAFTYNGTKQRREHVLIESLLMFHSNEADFTTLLKHSLNEVFSFSFE